MRLPGFDAASAVERPAGRYGTWSDSRQGSAEAVAPQWSVRRPTGPYGPIGLPGQDCLGACWHVCHSFGSGGFVDKCIADCLSHCAEPTGLTL